MIFRLSRELFYSLNAFLLYCSNENLGMIWHYCCHSLYIYIYIYIYIYMCVCVCVCVCVYTHTHTHTEGV